MVRRAVAKHVKPGPSIEAEVSPAAREAPWVYAIGMSVDKALTYMKPDLDFASREPRDIEDVALPDPPHVPRAAAVRPRRPRARTFPRDRSPRTGAQPWSPAATWRSEDQGFLRLLASWP
jgi:hypothetical protein